MGKTIKSTLQEGRVGYSGQFEIICIEGGVNTWGKRELLHALAGDRAAEQGGQLGIIASDLISSIRFYLNLRDI